MKETNNFILYKRNLNMYIKISRVATEGRREGRKEGRKGGREGGREGGGEGGREEGNL